VYATRLQAVLATAHSVCEPVARATGVDLSVPRLSREERVAADPERLRQILVNLFTNGLKFTPRGGRVWVEREKSEEKLQLHVADTGQGIPQQDLERVFSPFSRIDPTVTSRAKRGAGLGLPISRELARAMGGDVTARSDGRTGSVFTLTLPLPVRSVATPGLRRALEAS
jgi:signal transduction histidine kinase